eukprot:2911186-Pyramimonas_sp.AAC.1
MLNRDVIRRLLAIQREVVVQHPRERTQHARVGHEHVRARAGSSAQIRRARLEEQGHSPVERRT